MSRALKKIKRGFVMVLAIVVAVCSLSFNIASADVAKLNMDSERVVLDPGFGYQSLFASLANRLYKESPVTAYLPTRLPYSDWHYYGLKSELLKDGYEIYVYKTYQIPSDKVGTSAQKLNPKAVLFKIKAGTYRETSDRGIHLFQKENWTFTADQSAIGNKADKDLLTKTFVDKTNTVPIPGTTGFVTATGAGEDRIYSAQWTFDGKVEYSFESRTSIADFISVLYSFRPVINLLTVADIVLMPYETRFELQVGRQEAFVPRENKFVALSAKPVMIDGSVYLPITDIVRMIQGSIQYVEQEHSVYLDKNGYADELKLKIKTGEVYRNTEKIAEVPIHVVNGRTLVPLGFLVRQFGLELDYDPSSKVVSVKYSRWFTNHHIPEKAAKVDYSFTVFSTHGPSFRYENSRVGSTGSWTYVFHTTPQGYNGLKYTIYETSIPLLPGSNELVYSDILSGRVINTIPIEANLLPADIPYRYSGNVFYDALKMDLKLSASNGKVWPAGYVETNSFADITGAILSKGYNYSSLRLTYRQADRAESKPISFTVADDGSFNYRFKPEQGPGTYFVTLYNPPGSIAKYDLAAIVTFVVVVK